MADETALNTRENQEIRLGFDTKEGMDALLRASNVLSSSTLVPVSYRRFTADKEGTVTENPNGLANCAVALNMASRMNADPLMIMQNLHIIEGRPSWSSVYIIASINQCGKFSPLRFSFSEVGPEEEAPYTYTEWIDNPRNAGKKMPVEKTGSMKIRHRSCIAWVIEKATGERLESPEVSIQMAVDEGWIQKKGSKWKTMPEIMLRYRAASFFGKIYAPELLMGLQSAEETQDIIESEIIEEAPLPTIRKKKESQVSGVSWPIESLEEFDTLMDQAYVAFKDAGQVDHWPVFEKKWKPTRGNGDDKGTLRDLGAEVQTFLPKDDKKEG